MRISPFLHGITINLFKARLVKKHGEREDLLCNAWNGFPPKFTLFLKLLYAFWLWLSFGMPVLLLIVFYICLRTQNPLLTATLPTHTHTPFDKQFFNLLFDYQFEDIFWSTREGVTYKNPQLSSTVSTKCDEYCSNNSSVRLTRNASWLFSGNKRSPKAHQIQRPNNHWARGK